MVGKIEGRLSFKLKIATLTLFTPASRLMDVISLQKTCFLLVGFTPTKNYDCKAQFNLYKERERIHRNIADLRLLPIPRS